MGHIAFRSRYGQSGHLAGGLRLAGTIRTRRQGRQSGSQDAFDQRRCKFLFDLRKPVAAGFLTCFDPLGPHRVPIFRQALDFKSTLLKEQSGDS